MEIGKLPMAIVGITIAVLVCACVLIPVVDDAQHQQDNHYVNDNPYSRGTIYEFDENTNETTVIAICQTGERTITINGTSKNVSAWQPVFLSDAVTIRFQSSNMSLATYLGGNTIKTATITINNGIASFSDVVNSSDVEITIADIPISWAYIFDGIGDYCAQLVESTDQTFYAKQYQLYSSNRINTTNEYFSIKGDVVTITKSDGTKYTTPLNWGGEYLDDDVYKLVMNNSTTTDYTFVVDNNGEDYTVHPFYVCAPRSVTGTPDDLESFNTLLSVIPLLVVISIVIMVVGLITYRRM